MGLKLAMALSALVLVGYMLIHVLGNLLIFAGPEWINGWGAFLHATGPVLQAIRGVLLAAAVVHVAAGLVLAVRARRARPVTYERFAPRTPAAARTMLWSGIVLLVFVGFHIPQLTVGWWHPRFVPGDDHANVIRLFRQVIQYPIYAAALVALALHLHHGTWSLLRTLGIAAAERGPRRAGISTVWIFVTAGFVAILVAVAAGWLRAPQ